MYHLLHREYRCELCNRTNETGVHKPDELLGSLLLDWRDRGESPARYVEYLVYLGHDDMAAVVARHVLSKPDCPERSRIDLLASHQAYSRACLL